MKKRERGASATDAQNAQKEHERRDRQRKKRVKRGRRRDHAFVHKHDERDRAKEGRVKKDEQSDLKYACRIHLDLCGCEERKKLGTESGCLFGGDRAVAYLFHNGSSFRCLFLFSVYSIPETLSNKRDSLSFCFVQNRKNSEFNFPFLKQV